MLSKKLVMLGLYGVGKTSLVQRFVNSIFDDKYLSTLGVKVDKKLVQVDDVDVNLMLWDVAGAENHFDVPLNYIKGAAGYLLVVDGTREDSLEKAIDLVKAVEEGIGKLPFVMVVNKNDLEWKITETDIEQALATYDTDWYSTSAKTGENVDRVFDHIARLII
jgi:small GTP-binding protein